MRVLQSVENVLQKRNSESKRGYVAYNIAASRTFQIVDCMGVLAVFSATPLFLSLILLKEHDIS